MRVCLVVAVLAATGWAQDLESAHREARAALVEDLEGLADWCTKSRLFLDRNRTYRVLIEFEPDHGTARKWLRHRKTKFGWEPQKGFRAPVNRAPKLHHSWTRKLEEVGEAFADRLVPTLEVTKASAKVKAKVFADIFRLAPDHEDARRLNGQLRYGNAWMSRETVKSRQRRRELARFARTATFNVGRPRRGTLESWERKMGLRFTEVWETPTWRLVTTCGPGEGRINAQLAGACHGFFELVFDVTQPPRPGQIVFLVTTRDEFHQLLVRHPHIDERTRKRCWDISGAWTPKSHHLFEFSATPVVRREGCVRQPLNSLLQRRFGLQAKQGWAWEGIGLYLSEHLAGSKYITFVRWGKYARESKKKTSIAGRIYEEGADWFALGREMLKRRKFPEFRYLLGKDVNAMNAEDLVASYCLGAYIMEVFPNRAGKLLALVGKEKLSTLKAFPQALGVQQQELERKLHTWMAERR